MLPLLHKDGLSTAYVSLTIFFEFLVRYLYKNEDDSSFYPTLDLKKIGLIEWISSAPNDQFMRLFPSLFKISVNFISDLNHYRVFHK